MKIFHRKKSLKGLTLIELAIVLVIIGLISGSIVVGHSMIRSSEIQSVISDETRFIQAFRNFKDKYKGLPGDITNAEALWGSDADCPNTPYTTTPHQATCNGNGDGHIGINNGASFSNPNEVFRAWQQLANAGMIEGQYNGIAGNGSTYDVQLNVNTPGAKMSGTGYYVNYQDLPYGNSCIWPMSGNAILFGAKRPNYHVSGDALTPAEALLVDTKLDDGLPGSGKIVSFKPSIDSCATTSDSTAQYNISYSGLACSLYTNIDF